MIYAAVDLGTNAFRLLIVDKDKEEIIRRESEIIGLGAYINKDKLLFFNDSIELRTLSMYPLLRNSLNTRFSKPYSPY